MASERVLVTGASGYIGRHVVDELARREVEILVADPRADAGDPRVRVVGQSIFADSDNLFEELGSPDRVIHLAWQDGFRHDSDAHLRNLPLHVSFLRSLVDGGARSVSVMGTMHEVGYWEGAIDEHTPCNPMSFYGIAKNALRQASMCLVEGKATQLKWLRGFYIMGDDASNHSVFSKISEAAEAGRETFPFVSGKSKYDFIDVRDLAHQIVVATMQDEVSGIINCCSGVPVSLGEKAEEYIRTHGYSIRLQYGAFPDRSYDSPAIWGDPTKIREILSKDR